MSPCAQSNSRWLLSVTINAMSLPPQVPVRVEEDDGLNELDTARKHHQRARSEEPCEMAAATKHWCRCLLSSYDSRDGGQ
jgi:hypothetical protein